MPAYRNIALQWGHRLAGALPGRRLLRATGQRTLVPIYHTVSDVPLPHIRHLYTTKTSREFADDLDELLCYFDPVDFPTFVAYSRAEVPPSRPYLLLTFDDGLREFHDVIAPILLRKGVPAICFLNSAFIDNRGLFFRYKVSLLLDRLAELGRSVDPTRVQQLLGGSSQSDFRPALLRLTYQDQDRLAALAAYLEVDFAEFLRQQQPYLSSAQVKSLLGQGFHFGAHSVDHPLYRDLPLAEQLSQTIRSLRAVAGQFGLDYHAFAFPFTDDGVSRAFFTQLHREQSVDATFGTAGLKHDTVPYHYQRVPLEEGGLSAGQVLHTEWLYYLLKRVLGRNTIRRT